VKLGLLADIHANSEALSNIVVELRRLHIDTVIVAGDTVGYYYNIILVRELLSSFNVLEVKGNHENQILSNDKFSWSEYEKKYGSGLRRNKEDLKQDGIEHIRALSHPLEVNLYGCRIIVAHGTPWDIDEYLYQNSDSSSWNRIANMDIDIAILGHTHHQMLRKFDDKLIVNPGSVGQNRSAKSIADWAILDLSNMSIDFRSTPYSSKSLLKQCETFDPNLDILTRHLRVVED
jgi:putative phosphoesterase